MINKKKILITGSSSGIGYDAAKLYKKNYTVVGISRTKPKIGSKYKHIDFDLTNYSGTTIYLIRFIKNTESLIIFIFCRQTIY